MGLTQGGADQARQPGSLLPSPSGMCPSPSTNPRGWPIRLSLGEARPPSLSRLPCPSPALLSTQNQLFPPLRPHGAGLELISQPYPLSFLLPSWELYGNIDKGTGGTVWGSLERKRGFTGLHRSSRCSPCEWWGEGRRGIPGSGNGSERWLRPLFREPEQAKGPRSGETRGIDFLLKSWRQYSLVVGTPG